MDGRRYERMREIFHATCDLDEPERQQVLESACREDPELGAELVELFRIQRDAKDLRLESPVVSGSFLRGSSLDSLDAVQPDPDTIGGFRVLRRIGEGSMGVVYAAEQDHPRRTVALKVMRDWPLSEARLKLFRREANNLGRLQHTGIARVYDAGVGEVRAADQVIGKQPFLVLELIEGLRLTEFAEAHHLSDLSRLELVARICDSVHHAHCRGVVHCDLKPGNILVDAGGQPKVLDFGVSRTIDPEVRSTLQTLPGRPVGTLAYASPEQLHGELDTGAPQCDVYSLGVILYELLVGALPIEVQAMDLAQAIRTIQEAAPTPAESRKPHLRGDIAAILGKALEKKPEKRYASAAELADDIRRYLAHEPIRARHSTLLELLWRLVRRHRTAATGAALTLFGAIGGLSYGLMQARIERDAARAAESRALEASLAESNASREAKREARISAAVNQFLNEDLLAAAGPDKALDRDIRMRDVLDRAAARMDGRFSEEPLVEAALRMTIGVTYLRLGEHDAASPHIQRALRLRRELAAPTDPSLIETIGYVGSVAYQAGRFDEATFYLQEMLELCRRAYPGDHKMTVNAAGSLGALLLRYKGIAEAEPYLHEAELMQRRLDPTSEDMVPLLVNVAACRMRAKRLDEAESSLRDAIDVGRLIMEEHNPSMLVAQSTLAALYNERGQFDCAIPLLQRVASTQERVMGPEHPQTLLTRGNLGFAYIYSGQLEAADPLVQQVLATRHRRLGEGHPSTLVSLMHLAILRSRQGRFEEAEEIALRGVELSHSSTEASSESEWLRTLATVYDAQYLPGPHPGHDEGAAP